LIRFGMPQSHASVYLHAVFSTKDRNPFLTEKDLRIRTHAYIAGVSKAIDCPPVEVGGVDDHVHALVRFSRTISIADWLKEIKRKSSAFVKEHHQGFAWQGGYGVFAVEAGSVDRVVEYIRKQEEHHRKVSFQDELRQIMSEHGVQWDERYMWD
jgi:putative transposase